MSLQLPADLQGYVDQSVLAGRFSSAEEVVREAVRRMKEQDAKAAHDDWLRKELAIGVASLERGEGIDAEEAFRQLAEEFPDLFDDEDDAESDAQCA